MICIYISKTDRKWNESVLDRKKKKIRFQELSYIDSQKAKPERDYYGKVRKETL